MYQRAHQLTLSHQFVVTLNRRFRLQDVKHNPLRLQHLQRFGTGLKTFLNAFGQHDDGCPMREQFVHVSRLDTRLMARARFPPNPTPARRLGIASHP